jgi:hypothetical protein
MVAGKYKREEIFENLYQEGNDDHYCEFHENNDNDIDYRPGVQCHCYVTNNFFPLLFSEFTGHFEN